MSIKIPDFIIVGEARCGTTTLWEHLSPHPEIFFPSEKELHFFGSYDRFDHCGRWDGKSLANYTNNFRDASTEQICGEATPNYLSDQHSLDSIKNALGEIKCLIVLRDPIARAHSHYWQSVIRGWETLSFEDALESENERINNGDPNGLHDFGYFTRGLYAKNIARAHTLFGTANCNVTFIEEFRSTDDSFRRDIFNFLEISNTCIEPSSEVHRNKTNYPKSPVAYRLQLWLERSVFKNDSGLHKHYKRLGDFTRKYRGYSGTPVIEKRTKALLKERYHPHNQDLEALLGRSLPW